MIRSTYIIQVAAALCGAAMLWLMLDCYLTGRYFLGTLDLVCALANGWSFCTQANYRRHLKGKERHS